jgi:hypothetical protein
MAAGIGYHDGVFGRLFSQDPEKVIRPYKISLWIISNRQIARLPLHFLLAYRNIFLLKSRNYSSKNFLAVAFNGHIYRIIPAKVAPFCVNLYHFGWLLERPAQGGDKAETTAQGNYQVIGFEKASQLAQAFSAISKSYAISVLFGNDTSAGDCCAYRRAHLLSQEPDFLRCL